MTPGQIIDQLNIMGYKVLVGDDQIMVKKDHNHQHFFYHWDDIESYYNINNIPHHDNLLYVANSIFNSLLMRFTDSPEVFDKDTKTIENIADKSVECAKILISKCK